MRRMAKRSWRIIVPGRAWPLVAGTAVLASFSCGDASNPVDAAPRPAPVAADAVERREETLEAIDRLLDAQRILEAARVADRLAERHPDDAAVALRLGRVRLAQRSFDPIGGAEADDLAAAAADALVRAIAEGVDDRETIALAATLLEAADRPGQAESFWRTLADRDGPGAEVGLRLALNLERQGRQSEAIAVAETIRARHPDHAFAAVVLGELQLSAGDERGLALLREGAGLDPERPAWRMREAIWLRRLGRCEEAITLLSARPRNSTISGEDVQATRELAACWNALARPDKAASLWESLAESSPPRSPWLGEAWRNAAAARLELGDRSAAWQALQQASVADPGHPNLAELERAIGADAVRGPVDGEGG